MSTTLPTDSLSAALFAKSQAAILGLLYGHPDEPFYLRKIVQLTGLAVGQVQRELNRLAAAGILQRTQRDRHVYFQAHAACPVFPELRAMIRKTVGAAEVLRQALDPLRPRITAAFVYGSVARGTENAASDLDLMVIGAASFSDVVSAVRPAEQDLLRPINPTVYPPAEFRAKLAAGHHFLNTVMTAPRLLVCGSDDELRRLFEERLDQAPPVRARRNPAPAGHRRPRSCPVQGSRLGT